MRPLAKDIALMDTTRKFQRHNIEEMEQERQEFLDAFERIESQPDNEVIQEGYSSREIEASEAEESLEDKGKQ